MATTCPTCHSPAGGPYCQTCGTQLPMAAASVAPAGAAAAAPAAAAPAAAAAAPQKAGQRQKPAPASRAPVTPAKGSRGGGTTWGMTLMLAAVMFAVGVAAGYALALARGAAPTSAEAGQSPLTLASRYLDEGTQLMTAGSREAAATAFRNALRNWELALKENPENLYARTYMGLTQFYLGDAEAAFASIKQVLDRDPNYLWALFNAAWMSEVVGDTTAALAYYERYLAAAPTEQVQAGKYAEQPGLIERQMAAAREAIAKLGGTVPTPPAPQLPLPQQAPSNP